MDEKTSRLMSQLKDRMIEVSDGQITQIIQEARNEAFTEARAILKGIMVQAILEQAVRELEGALNLPQVPNPREADSLVQTSKLESEEQIQREIEAIRRKIAENERLLSQVKASPIETEMQEPSAEDEVSAPKEKNGRSHGYYVYGIVKDSGSQPVGGLPENGIDPAYPVYALPYQAIQAIVSKVSLREFGQKELKANLEDMKWLEAKVRVHQSILETVLASHTLIPMRFCTIYQSESRVQEMLAQNYDAFMNALSWLEGKQEWGVKVYCNGKTLAQRVGEISDRVKELKAEREQKSSGAAYFLKKKMDEAIAEEMERVSDEYAQHSHDSLSSHAEEAIINALQSKDLTGRKEAAILNGAYLVAEEQLAAFRTELESLAEEHSDLGFIYEMTGPWPPYNFVSIGFEEGAAHE
jgi:hypothetical protein